MYSTGRFLLLAISALISCTSNEGSGCEEFCTSMNFEVAFFNQAMERVDSLEQDSVRVEILTSTSTTHKDGATLDCDACQSRFTQSRLVSDRSVRAPDGRILPPSTNLMDPKAGNPVGTGGKFSLNIYRATTLESGTHRLIFTAQMDNVEITAYGTLWVPDSLGF